MMIAFFKTKLLLPPFAAFLYRMASFTDRVGGPCMSCIVAPNGENVYGFAHS